MSTVSVNEVQRDLLGCIHRLLPGEALVVTQDQEPIAEIKRVPHVTRGRRPSGLAKGEFSVPADFDAPDPETHRMFEGE